MSAPGSLPRWLRTDSTNGYSTPTHEGDIHWAKSVPDDGDRKRHTYTAENGDSTYRKDAPPKLAERSDQQVGDAESRPEPNKAGFRDRVGCYTWTWFTMTMATGGIANVLHAIPYRSRHGWLDIIGTIVFLFNLGLFIMNCIFITVKFRLKPGSFKASFQSQSESLFIPACIVSVGTILTNMAQYGIPFAGFWFQRVMQILFWAYASSSVLASTGMYLVLWSTQAFPIQSMTPIWIFPAYPMLLVGPFAANLIDALPSASAAADLDSVAIAFGAVCIQGTGFLVSLMIYAAFMYRLMTQKLPRETTRPGMFVSVGPSGFTVAGIVHLGNTVVDKILPDGYLGINPAANILKLMSAMTGLWIWGLCLWFFIVSVGAHWQLMRPNDPQHHIRFDMTWFSFVFPNTALVTATLAIGKTFGSNAIEIFGTVLAVILVAVEIFVFGMMIRAYILKRLLWPGELDGSDLIRKRWLERYSPDSKISDNSAAVESV